MLIEIHRYEQFYTVRHRERNVIGDTVTELKSFELMEDWVLTLLKVARRQLLEEIIITRECNDKAFHYLTRESKANDIIPDLDEDGEPVGPDPLDD